MPLLFFACFLFFCFSISSQIWYLKKKHFWTFQQLSPLLKQIYSMSIYIEECPKHIETNSFPAEETVNYRVSLFVSHVAQKPQNQKPPAASDLKSQHCGRRSSLSC